MAALFKGQLYTYRYRYIGLRGKILSREKSILLLKVMNPTSLLTEMRKARPKATNHSRTTLQHQFSDSKWVSNNSIQV